MSDSEHPRLSTDQARAKLTSLDTGWSLSDDGDAIERTIACKGFAKAVYLANLAAYHADRQRHHPDIAFGMGYFRIGYTTHDVDGLSEKDFINAAAFDRLVG